MDERQVGDPTEARGASDNALVWTKKKRLTDCLPCTGAWLEQVLYALATKAIEEERQGRWERRQIEESLGRLGQGQVGEGRSKSRGRASSRSSKGSRGTSRGASTRSSSASSASSRASSQDGIACYRL
jgi:hypothetical protein